MDYKKAYKDALSRAKDCHVDKKFSELDETAQQLCEYIFPELVESEDERIRKSIVKLISNINGGFSFERHGITKKEVLAWLEKQGEQNLTPKFKVDDWVVFNNDLDSIYQVEKIENYEYTLRHILGGSMCLSFSHENMIRAWTIQDVKDGDVLASKNGCPFIYKKSDGVEARFYCCVCFDNSLCIDNNTTGYCGFKDSSKPASVEQRALLFSKTKEAGYEWDAEKKELKKIDDYCKDNCKGFQETGKCFADGECKAKRDAERNPAWNEEDEKMMQLIHKYVKASASNFDYQNIQIWFRNIKDRVQPHWKPTVDQMQSLNFAIITYSKKDDYKLTYDSLNSLYDDLKKL